MQIICWTCSCGFWGFREKPWGDEALPCGCRGEDVQWQVLNAQAAPEAKRLMEIQEAEKRGALSSFVLKNVSGGDAFLLGGNLEIFVITDKRLSQTL